jgi:hypothetical protein
MAVSGFHGRFDFIRPEKPGSFKAGFKNPVKMFETLGEKGDTVTFDTYAD